MKISIIVPCYNEEEVIEKFYSEVSKVKSTMKKTEFEIIFVNDGSKDKTLEKMRALDIFRFREISAKKQLCMLV